MKILVYGAGAVGSQYAAQLHRAGHEVSILARGQRLSDLREYGIVLEEAGTGHRTVTRTRVVDRLDPEDAYDLAIVVVRKNQVTEVLPALAANRHTPNVLFMGNNAAGADAYIAALGRDRVLLGFGGVGGVRKGHVVRYLARKGRQRGTTYVGELDGRPTERLMRIVEAFEWTSFPVTVLPNVDAWLKTHAALIVPLVCALYMAGADNYRLAQTRDALVLMRRGFHEGLHALRALGVPIEPPAMLALDRAPEPVLVALLRRVLDSQAAEISIAGHANAAPDEMWHLAQEFRWLVRTSGVSTPALDRLYTFLDPDVCPVPVGSATIGMDWRGIAVGLGALAGTFAGVALAWRWATARRARDAAARGKAAG